MTIDIPSARPEIGEDELAAVTRVLRSGMLAQGPEVAAFESEFSTKLVQNVHCIAVNSGTSALHLSLLAAGIGAGDEVIVPSFTFAATANSVALTGATPVFADIEPNFYCLDPKAVEAAITPRTAAIMPVHLYGHPAAMVDFVEMCNKYNLLLIEDAAQAHGASLNRRPVGTWGVAGSFSFYPTKNMTSGEGGMVTTSDDQFARTVKLLRNQGQERRYENEIVGLNNRMTDIHAAIGRVQLNKLTNWNERRRANAQFLTTHIQGVLTPQEAPGAFHVYHQYTIRVEGMDRDVFAVELAQRGIGSGVYYPIPNHRLPAYSRTQDLPQTEKAAKECLSLPVYPSLSENELERIVEAVNEVAKGRLR
jgi:dTDP-4-amino-4,6-dideoxygalactose transaminase